MSGILDIFTGFDVNEIVANIKNKIGLFYTFESRINNYTKEISKGYYSQAAVNKLAEIKTLQNKLAPQVEEFVSMTGSIGDSFGDFEFSSVYFQQKLDELLKAGSTGVTFLTEVSDGISRQEQNFKELDALMAGQSTLPIKLQQYLTVKNVVMALGGYWLLKKIL